MNALSGCGAPIVDRRCPTCGRPTLLDAYSCAGGAGMGYHRAGFCVTGIDIDRQPHYPFQHIVGDAVAYIAAFGSLYAAIHGSPPCQHYANVTAWRGDRGDHPDLVGATRDAMNGAGRPWVIENVVEAPIRADYLLCGSTFGLRVRRHRKFETSWRAYELQPPCRHVGLLPFMHKGERAYADAMECTWMSSVEAREAIPPRFTEYIGAALMEQVLAEAVAA